MGRPVTAQTTGLQVRFFFIGDLPCFGISFLTVAAAILSSTSMDIEHSQQKSGYNFAMCGEDIVATHAMDLKRINWLAAYPTAQVTPKPSQLSRASD